MFEDGNRVSSCDDPTSISDNNRVSSCDYQPDTINSEPSKGHILDKADELSYNTNEAISNTFNNIRSRPKKRLRQTASGLFIALALAWWTPAFNSCEKEDITAPKIRQTERTINTDKWEKLKVSVEWNKLKIWKYEIASWEDDNIDNCYVSSMTISRKDSTWKPNTQDIKPWNYIDTSKLPNIITCTVTISDGKNTSTFTFTINIKDIIENQKPTITILKDNVNVTQPQKFIVDLTNNHNIKIGDETIATLNDEDLSTCTVSGQLKPEKQEQEKKVTPWDNLEEPGTLKITITDKEWLYNRGEVTLTVDNVIENKEPTITSIKSTVDVSKPKKYTIYTDHINIWDERVRNLSDEDLNNCTVSISFKKEGEEEEFKTVSSSDELKYDGTLSAIITDPQWLFNSSNITLEVKNQKPTINILKPEGVTSQWEIKVFINKDDNTIVIGDEPTDEPAISWTDDRTDNCDISVTFKKKNETESKPVSSWTTIYQKSEEWEWELEVVIDDKEWGKNNGKINITKKAPDLVNWLENIQSLSMKIDQEVNLLQWVTFSDWTTLEKLEIVVDGKRYPVNYIQQGQWVYSANYIPQIPWDYSVILTLNSNWSNPELVVNVNKAVNPLEYNNPTLETVDHIKNYYSWFNNLSPENQEFIKDHILISYITSEWYKLDNLEYIIAWETTTQDYPTENVWLERPSQHTNHADRWYKWVADMALGATIKTCWWNIIQLKDYAKNHPDKMFMVSCATDNLSKTSHDEFTNNEVYEELNEIFDNSNNSVFSISVWNDEWWWRNKKLNEDQPEQEGGWYTQASINSDLDNKYTVSWYNNTKNNIFWDDLESARPIWFGKENKNIVVAFIQPTDKLNREEESTKSSWPTAFRSSTLWNHLSVLVYNYHSTTLESANKIFVQKYLAQKPFMYKDQADWKIKEWGFRYFSDTDKFKNNELLHKPEIDAVQLNNEITPLPSGHWLYYLWPSIEFEYNWKKYNPSDNYDIRQTAISSWKDIQYYSNTTLDIKRGWKWTTSFKVGVLNKSGKKISDITTTITKNYDYEYFTNSLNYSNYNQSNYSQPYYNQSNYSQPYYNQPNYNQPNYNQPNYNQPNYNQPNYNQPNYNQPNYD